MTSQVAVNVQTATGRSCIAPDFVAVGQWGTSESFAQQLGRARKTLMGEFDRDRPGAALDMARLYVFFGFGAEAIQVLHDRQVSGSAAEAVTAMAQLIDSEMSSIAVFDEQMDCASDAALWALLASGEVSADVRPNVDAILRALSDLPDHLKALLGARLARILAAGNLAPDAARVLRILDRQPRAPSPIQSLAQAETDLSSGDVELADAELAKVVVANTDASAEALLLRIWTRLDAGDAVAPEMVNTVAAIAREQRGTSLGPKLALAHTGALAASGQYDEAIGAVRKHAGADETQELDATRDLVALYIAQGASDLVFLKHFLPVEGPTLGGLTDATSNVVAARLLDLGFASEAATYLAGPAEGGEIRVRRLLRARINLKGMAPRAAMVDLLGLEGSDAVILRAQAHSQLGEHGAAHLLYLAEGKTDEALREALLAEEWDNAKDIADPVLTNVIGTTGADDAGDGSVLLRQNRLLLEQSANARADISRLLEAPTDAGDIGG